MCNEFHTLVEQSSWRYTAQCEHGTIHLRWGHLTLSLQPADFVLLTHIVSAEYHLCQPQNGRMRLNIGQTTVEFPFRDLQPLVQLIQQTAEKLASAEQPQRLLTMPVTSKPAKHNNPLPPFTQQNIYLN